MAEISRKVVPYEYAYICDKCKTGMMLATGEKNAAGLFPHKCMICGNKAELKKSYPHVEYFGEAERPS
jgi:DNA-directed RNA polymerase subunit RPC12/RpoP